VLEPLQATPVIIEDNVFIGAGCQVTEGAIVEEGSVLGMGCMISASTKIYDKTTGETFHGFVPKNSVVIPGAVPSSDNKSFYNSAIIIKKVNNDTRKKVSINELLREG
jgi:2,3,4,5-tetrahydropyridine-2-carboxylate N-succinyltransferase